jgi:hypothetical protein
MTDNYEQLARSMDCQPEEIPSLIQQHAPWNGRASCNETLRVVAWLRAQQVGSGYTASQLLAAIADAIERGEHRIEKKE